MVSTSYRACWRQKAGGSDLIADSVIRSEHALSLLNVFLSS